MAGNAYADRPTLCLAPIFDDGQRLLQFDSPNVYWLEVLMRQHEICWRVPAQEGEVRVVLAGNSAVLGHPWPAKDTFGARLNDHFATAHIPAHIFNLGFVTTYQLKDALIIHHSLQYHPDLILYAVTLGEFVHAYAPTSRGLFDLALDEQFLSQNIWEVTRFAAERPPGLTKPLDRYRIMLEDPLSEYLHGFRLGEIGAFIRAAVHHEAVSLRQRLSPAYTEAPAPSYGRLSRYDCQQTKRRAAEFFRNWQDWNILAYLQQVRAATGIEILIVNWPVAYEPVEDCYNVRYPAAVMQQYNQWMEEQTRSRGLRYVDLHALLPADEFVDSLHVGVRGHQTIADRLSPTLDSLMRDILQHRSPPAVEVGP